MQPLFRLPRRMLTCFVSNFFLADCVHSVALSAPWHVLENTTLHYLGNVKVALAWKVCKGSYSLESIPSYGKLTCKLVTTWNYSMVIQAWQIPLTYPVQGGDLDIPPLELFHHIMMMWRSLNPNEVKMNPFVWQGQHWNWPCQIVLFDHLNQLSQPQSKNHHFVKLGRLHHLRLAN